MVSEENSCVFPSLLKSRCFQKLYDLCPLMPMLLGDYSDVDDDVTYNCVGTSYQLAGGDG